MVYLVSLRIPLVCALVDVLYITHALTRTIFDYNVQERAMFILVID